MSLKSWYTVYINGQTHLLYGTSCLLTAVNLACHFLCEYLDSFSVNVFCHFCLADKKNFEEDELESVLRTVINSM